MRDRINFFFLNAGHFLDHLVMLVFATVAALVLSEQWSMRYSELIPYATPGFVAFGACALPAGWLADRWGREKMMVVFFFGIGTASLLTAFANTPMQMGAGLFLVGCFAAIYHPVGIALVLEGGRRTGMRIAVNGVWGNMGVAVAALLTGLLIDTAGWRAAFYIPGAASILLGFGYRALSSRHIDGEAKHPSKNAPPAARFDQALFVRVFAVILVTTALGGLVFQSTTFALPKVLAERAANWQESASDIGQLAFLAFAIGSIGQLIVGYLIDRTSPRWVFAGVAALQVVFFALMIGASGKAAIIISIGFMVAAFGQIPINDVLVGRVAKTEWRSRMLALRYAVTITVMASAVPVIAWVHGRWGFDRLFGILAITAVLILCAVLTLPRGLQTKPS